MEAWRTDVVEEAKTWLRTPWHHRARIKGVGVDCAQFLIGVYANAGLVEDFDTGEYPVDWMLHREEERFLFWIEKYLVPAEYPTPLSGDTVIWKFGRCFSHAAIVVEWPVVIHAYMKDKSVVWGNAQIGELSHRECLRYTKP